MQKEHSGKAKPILFCLLVLNLLLSLYVAFFKKDALWLETLKVGGSDNMQLVQQLYNSDTYKAQQTQALTQVMESMKNNPSQAAQAKDDTATTATTDATTLDQSKISELLQGAYYNGKKDARIVILEYSDLLCPFCKRHYNDQTIEKIVAKYPKDVALVFKNMPLVQLHPTAFKGAQGLACAGKLGGDDKYYAYLADAFQVQTFDDTNIVDIAKKIGLNASKFTACVEDQATTAAIEASIKEGQSTFGINGTPGNVIIDRQTGKYVIINGAYPFEKFDEEVTALLK